MLTLTSDGGDITEGGRYWLCDVEIATGRSILRLIGICDGGNGKLEVRCANSVKVGVGDSEV